MKVDVGDVGFTSQSPSMIDVPRHCINAVELAGRMHGRQHGSSHALTATEVTEKTLLAHWRRNTANDRPRGPARPEPSVG